MNFLRFCGLKYRNPLLKNGHRTFLSYAWQLKAVLFYLRSFITQENGVFLSFLRHFSQKAAFFYPFYLTSPLKNGAFLFKITAFTCFVSPVFSFYYDFSTLFYKISTLLSLGNNISTFLPCYFTALIMKTRRNKNKKATQYKLFFYVFMIKKHRYYYGFST